MIGLVERYISARGDDLHAAACWHSAARRAIAASANVATRAYADCRGLAHGPTDDARRLQNRLCTYPPLFRRTQSRRDQGGAGGVRRIRALASAYAAAIKLRRPPRMRSNAAGQRAACFGQSSMTDASMIARTVRRQRPQSAPAPHASAICRDVEAPGDQVETTDW